jgi:hypothetical protein
MGREKRQEACRSSQAVLVLLGAVPGGVAGLVAIIGFLLIVIIGLGEVGCGVEMATVLGNGRAEGYIVFEVGIVLGAAAALEGSQEGRQHPLVRLSVPGASAEAPERHGECRNRGWG